VGVKYQIYHHIEQIGTEYTQEVERTIPDKEFEQSLKEEVYLIIVCLSRCRRRPFKTHYKPEGDLEDVEIGN